MASSSYTNSANSFITEPLESVSCHYAAFPQQASSPDQDSQKICGSKRHCLILSSLLHAQDIAMVQGYSILLLEGAHDWANVLKFFAFPNACFWNRSWKRNQVKLWGHMTWRPRSHPNWVRVVRAWVESVNEIRRKKFSQGFECTKSARSLSFASFRLLASVCWRQFFRVKWNAEKPVQVAPSLSVQGWMGWTVGCEASPSLYKVCEVLLIWRRRFLIRFVHHHSRWNVKLSWDFFLGCRGLGVFFKCFGYWFQERFADKRRFSTSSKSMHWFLGVLCRMPSKDENKKTW